MDQRKSYLYGQSSFPDTAVTQYHQSVESHLAVRHRGGSFHVADHENVDRSNVSLL